LTATPAPDQFYVIGLRENNSLVIQKIYEQYASEVIAYITKNSGNVEDARDIMQEALLYMHKIAHNKPDFTITTTFQAYFMTVVRGNWLNELKKRSRTKVTVVQDELLPIMDQIESYEDMEESKRQLQLLDSCFKELPTSCQEVIRLSWEGIGMEEVSQKLNVSYGYARKRKCKCLEKLVKLIKFKSSIL